MSDDPGIPRTIEVICPTCHGNDSVRPWCTLCSGTGRYQMRVWEPPLRIREDDEEKGRRG